MPIFQPGDLVLQDYQIEAFIGEGSFGEVYRAQDRHLHQPVALKILRCTPEQDAAKYECARERFRLEARLGLIINHPGVIRVHRFAPDAASGLLVLVMEYAPGGSLADRIKTGPLAVVDVLKIARQLAAGLGALHAQDVVHRDLKPSNILFDAAGDARIADLGLAQPASAILQQDGSSSGDGQWPTQPGTPAYMSPEQD
ncbi:MAG TPA: serine/threonine-protein kinase, partial [Anaerolineaceae bacterium]|nr:serine/threonine-protein kinase [Anaerolineaceae bacterium]